MLVIMLQGIAATLEYYIYTGLATLHTVTFHGAGVTHFHSSVAVVFSLSPPVNMLLFFVF